MLSFDILGVDFTLEQSIPFSNNINYYNQYKCYHHIMFGKQIWPDLFFIHGVVLKLLQFEN